MTGKCAFCKKPLNDAYGESSIYKSQHLLCIPCWDEEDELIDSEGGNSTEHSVLLAERFAKYGPPNDYRSDD